jgi:plastocyanin
MVQRWANCGLFGALIVRSPGANPVTHEIPLFVHELAGDVAFDSFESPTLAAGQAFSRVFGSVQTSYPYYCKIHGVTMAGTIQITAGAPAMASVVIIDNAFTPATIQVAPAGTINCINTGMHNHVVFAPGGGASAFCLNGRSYVGNTPTIVADAGARLRWYLINMDLNGVWHNVHTHAGRWHIPNPPAGAADVHALSPTEGFVIDTVVPRPLRFLPQKLDDLQSHHPADACQVTVRGNFLFHCHIEEHMMQGLAGLVSSQERLWITADALNDLDVVLPYDDGNTCPAVDGTRGCALTGIAKPEMPGMPGMGGMPGVPPMGSVLANAAMSGFWELLPCNSMTLAVHFALLHTGKVLIFSGSANFPPRHASHTYGSLLWDYEAGTFDTPPITYDVFCSGQATLANGDVLAAGGTKNYGPFQGAPQAPSSARSTKCGRT